MTTWFSNWRAVFRIAARRRAQAAAGLLCASLVQACALVENYDDPDGPRYAAEFAPRTESAAEPLAELSVCSFNIELSEHIAEAIADLSGDEHLRTCSVILLQEMDWPGAQRIAEALAFDVVYYPGSVHSGKDFGNAVLSRWPILDDAKLILPHRNPSNGRIRIAVRATLGVPFAPITVYSVHGDTPWLGAAGRLDQADAVAADASRLVGPVIVGGDFNTSDPGSVDSTVERFTSRAFTWATAAVPPSAGGPLGKSKIDHVFVKEFAVAGAGTVASDASDHQPIWVNLVVLH
jgi:endonuclease/exonuclease/phosphatase (EEP) superfamily protein YafD